MKEKVRRGRRKRKREKNMRGKEGMAALKRWKKVGLVKEKRRRKRSPLERKKMEKEN